MGEAIITRAGGGGEVESIIPITPGYHTILLTLKDYDGGILGGYKVYCKDGSSNYNYTTNSKGQTLFVTNSGTANIFINNYNGSYRYIDFSSVWKNVDAPVGSTSSIEVQLTKKSGYEEFISNSGFMVLKNRQVNLQLVGGGGGGGGGEYISDDYGRRNYSGGGGGAGYLNTYNNQTLVSNKAYNLYLGSGGSGGRAGGLYLSYIAAGAGGTTYISNTSYSAVGGSGGNLADSSRGIDGNGGSGGLGKGAGYDGAAGSSSVSFAGGGGGSNTKSRGTPYGGSGTTVVEGRGNNGSRGGGGGGGHGFSWTATESWSGQGGSGGAGVCRITFM